MFNIKIFESLESTNTYIKQLIQSSNTSLEYNVIRAKTQTAGRGKLGRVWESTIGNLYTSLALKQGDYFKNLQDISLITIITCLSIGKTIDKYTKNLASIDYKWPNDVFVNRNKISGTLLEIEYDKNGDIYLIIGIGVNINHTPQVINNSYSGISIKDIINTDVSVDNFLKDLLNNFEFYLEEYKNNNNYKIIEEWKNKLLFLGSEIEVVYMNERVSGIFKDIDKNGYLILRKNNTDIIITAGDIFGIPEK